MKTATELRQILDSYRWHEINTHVHTCLCDGQPDMNVENIAQQAMVDGVKCVVLMPHYHKQVSDGETVLYHDTDSSIFFALREQIETYRQNGGQVEFLLSTEADIRNPEGEICVDDLDVFADVIDFLTPTMNYHPLLPLKAVGVTAMQTREPIHASGEYAKMVEQAGGIERILECIYTTQANAIEKAPCTAMLGHFFAAHSRMGQYSWFGHEPQHLPLMKEGAKKVIDACARKNAVIDITGMRILDGDIAAKREHDGFLHEYQRWFLDECKKANVGCYPGGDAHNLGLIGGTWFYEELLYGPKN